MAENYAFNNGSDFAQHIGNITNPDMTLGDWFRRFLMTPSEAASAGKYYDPSIQKVAAAQAARAPQMGAGMETPDQANRGAQDAMAILAARGMRPEDSPEGGSYGPPPQPQAMAEAERPFYGPTEAPYVAGRRSPSPAPAAPRPKTPSAPGMMSDRLRGGPGAQTAKNQPAGNQPPAMTSSANHDLGLAALGRMLPDTSQDKGLAAVRGLMPGMPDMSQDKGVQGFLSLFQNLFGQGSAQAQSPTATPRPQPQLPPKRPMQ